MADSADSTGTDPTKSETPDVFQYLIAEKNKVVVVTLIGILGARHEPELQRCLKELENLDYQIALVNMREVSGVDSYAINFMAQVKKLLRKKTTNIAICGVKPSIKDFLLAQGVLSKTEVFNNVKDALMRYTASTGSGRSAA
jgi:anti-anti-sigma factor